MKKKDTYKYELHDGHKTVYVGITKDPKRREAEHRADGKEFTNMTIIGRSSTAEGAGMWESFFDNVETISDIFDKRISSIPINEVAVKKGIAKLEKEIADINLKIRELTRSANSVISSIFNTTKKYLQELGIDESHNTEKYLFTSNLKELSGAILHKTVFAFRLACLLEVEKHLNIKFPIILDSPSGKEIDKQNIEAMVEILKRDFANNQIIIASIYEYRLPNINKISIVNRLIE